MLCFISRTSQSASKAVGLEGWIEINQINNDLFCHFSNIIYIQTQETKGVTLGIEKLVCSMRITALGKELNESLRHCRKKKT